MLEDSIPAHVKPSARLAPQEIYRSKIPRGVTELTKTDRNRLRRNHKVARKAHFKQQEERAEALARLDGRKQGALDKRNALKSLSKNKNVTILSQVGKKVDNNKKRK